jgi:two-component system OmpR family sensor kinase
VKLTSTARLRLVTLATAFVLTAGIGTFLAESSYRDSLSTIDSSITGTINDAKASPAQELSAALFHIDEYSLDLSLYLISRDGTATTVNESTGNFISNLTLKEVSQATSEVKSGNGRHDFRYRALEISGGDYLVVAASSSEAASDFRSNLFSVLLITIFTSLLTFYLLSLYIRRLKQRDDADALARMQAFLGDASHELRTPLTVIKGYVEMLSKGQMSAPEDQSRAFNRVSTEITRMETLIHDLLLLAELGESAQRESHALDLSEVVRAHSEDFKTLNNEREVIIEVARGVSIEGVRDYIARFIQNALNNISRHTDSAAPVRISLTNSGKYATLTIEDGGKGLPENAYKEKVKSLTRFDPSRSRESGGSGLGMSIMAAVVAKSGGELRLRKSELGGLAVVAEFPTYRG